ncbi:chemotaxis protein [Rhodobacter sp. NSM]|uniref:chemotaxis protein n=1 Tax=Rhodobacter sp. NSM TaxID=3457501 RepID=UPI003FD345B6
MSLPNALPGQDTPAAVDIHADAAAVAEDGSLPATDSRRPVSASALQRAAGRVSSLAQATEKAFLRAGSSLERAISRFDRLSAPLTQLAAVAEAGEFRQATTDAGLLEESAITFAEQSQPLFERIVALSTAAGALGSDLGSMRQVIRTMSIVALNARVTVASLPGQNSGLDVFTTAATAQVIEAGDIIGQIADAVEQMALRLDLAAGEAANLSHLLRRQLGPALAGLRLDMAAFEADLARTTADGSVLLARGDEFRRAVTTAVLSLQIGDTTRQRLEHVAAILLGAVDSDERSDAVSRVSLLLAAAHLRDAHERHAAAIVTARSALRDSAQSAAEIGRLSGRVGNAPRHNLKLHLEQLRSIIECCRTTQSRLVSAARELSEGLGNLLHVLERMSGVEERMSMIGLNAVIACVQLGDEALALREISLQLRDLAATSADRLGQITQRLSAMGDEALTAAVDLEGRFKDDLDQLTNAGDRVFTLLSQIETGILETGSTVERERRLAERDVAAGIFALDGHSASFSELVETTPALESLADLRSGDAETPAAALALPAIRTAYTMAAERLVHDTLLAELGLQGSVDDAESAEVPADDIADFLF